MTPDDRAAIERAAEVIAKHAISRVKMECPIYSGPIANIVEDYLSPLLSARDARIGELEAALKQANVRFIVSLDHADLAINDITAALSPPAETKEQERP